jgi:uncharacterized protein YjaZ
MNAKTSKILFLIILTISITVYFLLFSTVAITKDGNIKTNFVFIDSEQASFTPKNKQSIETITKNTISKMYALMPELAAELNFNIRLVDRDLTNVYGVTGRADRKNEIEISISSSYQGGIEQAVKDGLIGTVFHELHHTVRGWTMHRNHFPQGINTAAINEGLADVFAEIQVGRAMDKMSKEVDFALWSKEIISLPKNADYNEWMNMHSDGREAVGYRTGGYLVRAALKNSGKDIVTLSYYSIEDIYQLAGY